MGPSCCQHFPSHNLHPVAVGPWAAVGQGGLGYRPPLCLLSALHLSSFDAQDWACGAAPVSSLSVAASAQRLRDLQLWQRDGTHRAGAPYRPAIWEDDWHGDVLPQAGLRAAEARQMQRIMQERPRGELDLQAVQPEGEGDGSDPPWLDLQRLPVVRVPVHERAAARLANVHGAHDVPDPNPVWKASCR